MNLHGNIIIINKNICVCVHNLINIMIYILKVVQIVKQQKDWDIMIMILSVHVELDMF